MDLNEISVVTGAVGFVVVEEGRELELAFREDVEEEEDCFGLKSGFLSLREVEANEVSTWPVQSNHREEYREDVPILDVFPESHRLVHQIESLPEPSRNTRQSNNVFWEITLPPRVPLCDLFEVDSIALQPDPEGFSPLREEL